MGSGRTGSRLASDLDRAGHEVTVIDWSPQSLDRLPDNFGGRTHVGNAVDQDTLREVGLESADVFVAATSGDNRNIVASQIAQRIFHVPRVVARIKDPQRAQFFNDLGLHVDCRTTEGAEALLEVVDQIDLQQPV